MDELNRPCEPSSEQLSNWKALVQGQPSSHLSASLPPPLTLRPTQDALRKSPSPLTLPLQRPDKSFPLCRLPLHFPESRKV
jgi:hypothetical protein